MFTEQHAPKNEKELSWSTQKWNQLKAYFNETQLSEGSQLVPLRKRKKTVVKDEMCSASSERKLGTPSLLLMLGPAGCGKLSALRVYCQVEESKTQDPHRLQEFHTEDFSTKALVSLFKQFMLESELWKYRSLNEGNPSHTASHSTENSNALPIPSALPNDVQDFMQPHRFRFCQPNERGSMTTAIKFYDRNRLSSKTQALASFVNEYEALIKDTFQPSSVGGSSTAPSRTLLEAFLYKNRFVFVYTFHDSHSAKSELHSFFPKNVISNTCCKTFFCTSLTEKSISQRLRSILQDEYILRSSATSLPRMIGMKRDRKSTAAISVATMKLVYQNWITEEAIDSIAKTCGGDIRYALNLLCWALYDPPCTSAFPFSASPLPKDKLVEVKEKAEREEVEKIWNRLRSRPQSLLRQDDIHAVVHGRSSLDEEDQPPPVSTSALPLTDASEAASHCRVSTKKSSFHCSIAIDISDSEEGEEDGSPALMESPLQVPYPNGSSFSSKTVSCDLKPFLASSNSLAMSKMGASSSVLASSFPKAGDSQLSEQNPAAVPHTSQDSFLASRDQSINFFHFVARLLCGKYSLDLILSELNSPPSKLTMVMFSNMHLFFQNDELEAYAACVAAASEASMLQFYTTWSFSTFSRVALSTEGVGYRVEMDQPEQSGLKPVIDLFGAFILDFSYRLHLPQPSKNGVFKPITSNFYFSLAYPRITEVPSQWRPSRGGESRLKKIVDLDPIEKEFALNALTKQKLERVFLNRWKTAVQLHWSRKLNAFPSPETSALQYSLSSVADVIRESFPSLVDRCSSLFPIVLEYVPYARKILCPYSIHQGPRPISHTQISMSQSNKEIVTPLTLMKAAASRTRTIVKLGRSPAQPNAKEGSNNPIMKRASKSLSPLQLCILTFTPTLKDALAMKSKLKIPSNFELPEEPMNAKEEERVSYRLQYMSAESESAGNITIEEYSD